MQRSSRFSVANFSLAFQYITLTFLPHNLWKYVPHWNDGHYFGSLEKNAWCIMKGNALKLFLNV